MVAAGDAGQPPEPELIAEVAARVGGLAASYRPPDFGQVPGPDAALFLCAIDHRTGYREHHEVDGDGPYEGSALLWALACAAEGRHPGSLTARALTDVDEARVEEMFRIGGETIGGPAERAQLWRNLAAGLIGQYGGSCATLLASSGSRLGGGGGLIARLGQFEAFADPLGKKSFLFAKIAARRGWLEVADPERWQVCADNVLMRLALRCGLVSPGPVESVRSATRTAFKRVADAVGVEPPLLDDLLWELGRANPDLLGTAAGNLREPPRPEGTLWY